MASGLGLQCKEKVCNGEGGGDKTVQSGHEKAATTSAPAAEKVAPRGSSFEPPFLLLGKAKGQKQTEDEPDSDFTSSPSPIHLWSEQRRQGRSSFRPVEIRKDKRERKRVFLTRPIVFTAKLKIKLYFTIFPPNYTLKSNSSCRQSL